MDGRCDPSALPRARLARIYEANREGARRYGLGASWTEFQETLARLRRVGSAASEGELDPGFAGIDVPVLSGGRRIRGSIAAAEIGQALAELAQSVGPGAVPGTTSPAKEASERARQGGPP